MICSIIWMRARGKLFTRMTWRRVDCNKDSRWRSLVPVAGSVEKSDHHQIIHRARAMKWVCHTSDTSSRSYDHIYDGLFWKFVSLLCFDRTVHRTDHGISCVGIRRRSICFMEMGQKCLGFACDCHVSRLYVVELGWRAVWVSEYEG